VSYRKRPTDPPPRPEGRDRAVSAFTRILKRLVDSSPGALGASFADEEGEAVDYHVEGDPMELKLATAYMGILANLFEARQEKMAAGPLEELWVSSEKAQFLVRPVGHGYQVTVTLRRVATIPKLRQALEQALVRLRIEAGGVID
jgi:predicted regulator of Ras-like GTPase activity (Roadblock/LC7/MglB family)